MLLSYCCISIFLFGLSKFTNIGYAGGRCKEYNNKEKEENCTEFVSDST